MLINLIFFLIFIIFLFVIFIGLRAINIGLKAKKSNKKKINYADLIFLLINLGTSLSLSFSKGSSFLPFG